MMLHSPGRNLFLVSLMLAIAAVLSLFVALPGAPVSAFWILLVGYAMLVLGVTAR